MGNIRDDEQQIERDIRRLEEETEELEGAERTNGRLLLVIIRQNIFQIKAVADLGIKIDQLLANDEPTPVRIIITQGENMPLAGTITGLQPGASDTFFASPVDASGNADALPAGSSTPSWVSSDTTVNVVAADDGRSAVVTAAATATPGSSFSLTTSATLPDSTVITGSATVPILAPPPPPAPVAFVLSQGKPAA